MTDAPEVYSELSDDDAQEPGRHPAAASNGDPQVAEVLASLEELDGRPLAEHAEVFEHAHEQLRAALDPDRDV